MRFINERLPGMEMTAIRSCDIRRIVRDHLAGFAVRQKIREWTRRLKREARQMRAPSPRGPRKPKGEKVAKSPIVFRASFKGPQWAAFHMPGAVEVEIYHAAVGPPAEWKCRRPGTKIDFPFFGQSTPQTVKNQMLIHFKEQASEWEAFDGPTRLAQRLQADEWATDNQGRVYITDLRRSRFEAEKAKPRAVEQPAEAEETAKVRPIR